MSHNKYMPMEIIMIRKTKLTDKERDQLWKIGGCFFFCEVGHMSRDCPQKRKTKITAIEPEEMIEHGKDEAQ